jgi:hypothetical protein
MKPSTTDEDFGSPKQKTAKLGVMNSMAFSIGLPGQSTIFKDKAKDKTRNNLSTQYHSLAVKDVNASVGNGTFRTLKDITN